MNVNLTLKVFSRRTLFSTLIGAALLFFFCVSPVSAQDEEGEENQNAAVEIFNRAQDAHEKGDLTTALKLYDEALKLAPEFPEVEYQKGSALLSLGKTAEAEKSFRRAVELREDWTLPMASLGAILVDSRRFDEAAKILSKAIELDANNSPAYAALTDLRLKTDAPPPVLKKLLDDLQKLTAKANPTAAVWAARAALERNLSYAAAAKASLNRALTLDPKNKSALIERAEIAAAEGDFPTAFAAAKTLSQISPDAAAVKLLQARIYALQGKPAEALKILDSIENPTAEVSDLRVRIAANESVDAAAMEKLLEREPKNAALLGRLCAVLRTENPVKALEYCRRAAESEPDNINHAIGFGAALVQAKQYENAVTIFNRLLRIAPENSAVRANLATAFFQLKRYAEAKTEYIWLTEKQPDAPVAYYFLAIAHDNLGEYTDAMANYQQFLKLADAASNKLEIEKVRLRLPSLQKQIKEKKGK